MGVGTSLWGFVEIFGLELGVYLMGDSVALCLLPRPIGPLVLQTSAHIDHTITPPYTCPNDTEAALTKNNHHVTPKNRLAALAGRVKRDKYCRRLDD